MFQSQYLEQGKALSHAYQAAQPFPHIILDDFIEPNYLKAVKQAALSVSFRNWFTDHHSHQVSKYWYPNVWELPQPASNFLLELNAQPFVSFLEDLTGIPALLPDMTYTGGGFHSIFTGGKLGIHADFNYHKKLNLHRRLNALLFLNEDWEENWGGHLELWEKDMSKCAVKILPIFNRLVIFTVNDDSFHGHPEPLKCPANVQRTSIALYYYTAQKESPTPQRYIASWK